MRGYFRRLAALVCFSLAGTAAWAGPPSLENLAGDLGEVPQIVLSPPDVQALKTRIGRVLDPPQPLVVAAPIRTQLMPPDGRWEPLNNGDWVWRLRLASAGAKSLHLRLEELVLPPGAELFVYAPGGGDVRGPYRAEDVSPEGRLWTPVVRGDQAVVEIVAPVSLRDQMSFRISYVYYGFVEFWKADEVQFKEGSCHIDVVCPDAAGRGDIIRSAGRIQFDIVGLLGIPTGTALCSGQLLNNTAGDGKAYFLTANHCIATQGAASSVVAYWNFQKSSCGGANDGSLNQTTNGSTLRASWAAAGGTDFTLLEFTSALSPAFNLFLSGWDRSDPAPASAVSIHHPQGTEKRISFENDPVEISNLPQGGTPGDGNALRVVDWDLGTTEEGSSGGGLWNAQNLLVGQLSQGASACGNNESDWYGRFARSWAGGGASSNRLSNWLDPGGTGTVALGGRSAIGGGGGAGGAGGGGSGGTGGGSGNTPPQPVDDDDDGGGCALASSPVPGNGLLGLLIAAGAGFWHRRRARSGGR